MRSTILSCLALAAAFPASAQQSAWGQCGGSGYSGSSSCISGYSCITVNSYYSQCQPGGAATTIVTSTSRAATTGTPTSSTPTSTGTAGTGPGTTLISGYYWIRAVEDPNFHKYLQTNPGYTAGTAILDTYTKAGQFQVVDGQLVELIDGSGGLLYANVAQREDADDMTLAVSFEKTKNSYGTFAFSGDALTWTVSGITRPNNAAWLVCANQQLFINLGPYAYQTPAGCADETIHYYNDSHAVA